MAKEPRSVLVNEEHYKKDIELLIKRQPKIPSKRRVVKMVHAEYKELVSTITSTLQKACTFRVQDKEPRTLRYTLIPIYKYLAGHLPDIFKIEEEIPYDLLSDFKLNSLDVVNGRVDLVYVFHYEGKKTKHYLSVVHELYPFTRYGLPTDWEIV